MMRTPPLAVEQRSRVDRALIVWLASICAMIVSMVILGGITRLTGSGLSIVVWDPIIGAIPPVNTHEWLVAFAKYQHSPQYELVNTGMTLQEFKGIFFWEYLHRLVARLIGVVVLVPWLYLTLRRRISRKLTGRLAIGFILGGLQGAMGWFMVKSGLVNRPSVSHFRLAAHLVLALLVLAYFLWLLLDIAYRAPGGRHPTAPVLRSAYRVLMATVLLQIVYGAFTAGTRAGFGFNTFPTMNGAWIPDGLWRLAPAWENVFNNRTAIQFIHRSIAWLLLSGTLGMWLFSQKMKLTRRQRVSIHLYSAMVCVQFALGVATLLLVVPISLAVVHQLGATLVFAAAVATNHALS